LPQIICTNMAERRTAQSGKIWPNGQPARSCKPIGIFTTAATRRRAAPAPSLTTLRPAHCQHRLRNGHRNQIAYSLYLFIRDVADGDLVGWIDDRWEQVNDQGPWRSEIVTPRAIKKTQDQRSGRRVPRHTRKDECLMDLNKTTATKHASSPQTDAPRKWGGRGAKLVFVQMLWGGRRT
jgi:hypothetical protein